MNQEIKDRISRKSVPLDKEEQAELIKTVETFQSFMKRKIYTQQPPPDNCFDKWNSRKIVAECLEETDA